jgi:hypothetical protein
MDGNYGSIHARPDRPARAGRRPRQRAIARHGEKTQSSIGSLEAAVFALLGLLIAFTFSGALSRFDSRRVGVVQEANAVGTAWMRIDLLPKAAQPKLRETMRAYVDSRIATYAKLPDIAASKAQLERSRDLQSEIWSQAGRRCACRRRGRAPSSCCCRR